MPVPYQKHGRRHAPTGEDPIPGLGGAAPLRIALCEGSTFTATDGSYYGLAQLVGADPSLFGCADTIEIHTDPGDGTGTWYVRTDGSNDPGVLQMYNEDFLMGYDIGVTFDGAFTALAELWVGYGVGAGAYAYEYVRLENPTDAEPTLRLTGSIPVNPASFGPSGNGQKIGGVLICTGTNVDVLRTWCYLSNLSECSLDTLTLSYP